MSPFFINTYDGRVATMQQLIDADLFDPQTGPVAPWHQIKGPDDASTMWYAVLRKRLKGVFIGLLCFRHGGRQASLEAAGWVEVPMEAIGVEDA